MDAVTVPQPISPIKDFLAKSQQLLIDGIVSMEPAVKHLKASIPQRILFLPRFRKEERKISIAL